MATMATSHGLSVLTNSCIKSPINHKTGLSASFSERPQVPYRFSDSDEYVKDFEENGFDDGNVMAGLSLDDVASQLQLLSDDEFYERLQALKEEQKKTLKRCEELYNAKLSKEQSLTTQEVVDDLFDRNDIRPTVNGHVSDSEESMNINGYTRSSLRDSIKDMTSSKPPISPQMRQPTRHGLRDKAVMSHTLPVKSKTFKERPSSAPAGWRRSRSLSLEEDDWRKVLAASGNEISGDEGPNRSNEDLDSALSRIDNMWDNFSLEDYVVRERRHSSASLQRGKKGKRLEDNWRNRLTIPQPFKMTLREEIKEKKKTRAHYELDEERLEREKQEEAECQKKFKASPAPAHIYLPLYDEIMEKNEARRRYVKQYCTEMLKSQVKPFNFMTREEEKKKYRPQSAPSTQHVKKEKKVFKAKPVPEYLYDNTVNEKMIEDEEYRKIRIRMRSEELMREAALPPNMEARQRMKEQKLREKAMKSKRKQHFKPRINRHVPDYDQLYNQFQRELARRKRQQEATVMEPFTLETNHIPSRKERVMREIERDEHVLRENRWPYRSPRITPRSAGILSTSLDSIPTKMTHGAQLRKSMTRDRIERLTKQEQEEMEEDRRRRIREMRLRKTLSERTSIEDTRSRKETVRDRLKKMRESEIERREQYECQLQEMRDKIDRRPLLVEQQSQVNAKKKAEKRFASTLKSVGLDEDFLQSHSSATFSRPPEDDYENDSFDDTLARSAEDVTE